MTQAEAIVMVADSLDVEPHVVLAMTPTELWAALREPPKHRRVGRRS